MHTKYNHQTQRNETLWNLPNAGNSQNTNKYVTIRLTSSRRSIRKNGADHDDQSQPITLMCRRSIEYKLEEVLYDET
eukprot:3801480-Amphidinium_carterae.1